MSGLSAAAVTITVTNIIAMQALMIFSNSRNPPIQTSATATMLCRIPQVT